MEEVKLSVEEMNDAIQTFCRGHYECRGHDCEGCPIDEICTSIGGDFKGYPEECEEAYNILNKHIEAYAAEATENETIRAAILNEARGIICSDRNKQYGEPEDNFAVIASYWNSYIAHKGTSTITAEDVANMMVLFKMGRITTQKEAKKDSYVDLAGYIACAAEIALRGSAKV